MQQFWGVGSVETETILEVKTHQAPSEVMSAVAIVCTEALPVLRGVSKYLRVEVAPYRAQWACTPGALNVG